MYGEDVAAGFRKGFEERIGGRNHQVAIKRRIGVAAQRLDHVGAEGDVRHEVPVHDIEIAVTRTCWTTVLPPSSTSLKERSQHPISEESVVPEWSIAAVRWDAY
ncbi:hypothetical protein D9M70_591820 [compost metagenome]